MYTTLATRLSVGTTAEVSQPVSMDGANAVIFDFTVFDINGAAPPTLTVNLEGSNDLENWVGLTSTKTAQAAGYFESQTAPGFRGDIGVAYVRLNYQMTVGTNAVINAGINTFHE